MQKPELLPPENALPLDKKPEMKLWHLPLAVLCLCGIVGAVGLILCVAVALEATLAVTGFVIIAGLVLVFFPVFFPEEYRKRRAQSPAAGSMNS